MRYQKFTNQQLYSWMVGQLSGIYFQSYQLAYDVAKRAERTYRYELGLRDSSFVQFGYWDSLKKGLLAGERLQLEVNETGDNGVVAIHPALQETVGPTGASHQRLKADVIKDIWMVCHYSVGK